MKQRSVSVIITNPGGRFLLQLRKQDDTKIWTIPGDNIKKGESPKEAVIRKATEEAGIILKDIEFVDRFDHNDMEEHIFCAKLNDDVEGEDIRFFSRNEIKNIKLSPDANKTLERFFRKGKE